MNGYNKFLDSNAYPAVNSNLGTLNTINLDTGDHAWKIPLGEYPELTAQGMKERDQKITTAAGGLFFVTATAFGERRHAHDKLKGKLLWSTTRPQAGNATTAMYEWKGKQYLVIPAGGRGRDSGGS